jgi:bifunctional DNA-binding transcriptional regulator/antitoxin component of YhaV-PrlF toxin-antitoxin module
MRVNARGQVTIPVEIRKLAGLLPHTKVIVDFDGENVRIVRDDDRGRRLVAHLRGSGDLVMSTEAIMALTRAE